MSHHYGIATGGRKLQIFMPEGVPLPCKSATGELFFTDGSEPLLWSELHPNPFAAMTGADGALPPQRTVSNNNTNAAAGGADRHITSGQATHKRDKRDKRDPEQWPFYCDACQKGFATQENYDVHKDSHVYCTVEGCHFTCRKDKAYRMEEHMELLHNRPDAPNFADMSKYLDQRRSRFPTSETVQTKVAELYYKAARGAVLPDERRRWMKQHGIHIGKQSRSGQAYIAAGRLEDGRDSHTSEAEQEAQAVETAGHEATDSTALRSSGGAPPMKMARREATTSGEDTASAPGPSAGPVKRPHMVPLGPNGTLTAQQRVQLVQQRYADAEEVPRFYVCNRCGKKGAHWVSACPTRGDPTFDRHVNWGETKRERPVPSQEPTAEEANTDVGTADSPSDVAPVAAPLPVTDATGIRDSHADDAREREAGAHNENDDDDDEAPPPAESAKVAGEAEGEKERTRLVAPVAAARMAAKAAALLPGQRRRGAGPQAALGGRAREPALYERLTEEDRVNEMGLLLQAFRFMVSRDFFEA